MEMDEERCTVDAAELSLGAAVHAVAFGTANERRAAAAAEIFIDCCCYQIIIDKFMAKVDMTCLLLIIMIMIYLARNTHLPYLLPLFSPFLAFSSLLWV
jgi:hypothetical protein